jgi:Zn-dependent M28 family amino/carboxypeptidase
VPLDKIVANFNLDMIGRNNPDSIVVIGQEHSNLGATLAAVNARHPELRMTTSEDLWPEQRFYERSDHFNFARYGVPVLFFFNGIHDQYHRVADHVDLIDTDKLSRVARIAFYAGAEVAHTVERPKWDPASYEKFVVKK